MSQPPGHDSMKEKLARRWDAMAAKNEAATRAAAERRLGFVMTAFRGLAAQGGHAPVPARPPTAGSTTGPWSAASWWVSAAAAGCAGSSPGSGSSTCSRRSPACSARGTARCGSRAVCCWRSPSAPSTSTVLATWERYPQRAYVGLAVIVALTVTACLVYGGDWTSMWIYVSAATGFVFPGRRRAMLAVVACGACYALLAWICHVSATQFLLELLPVVLVGWAMVGFRLQLVLMFELRQARETVAKLAANEERLRLARDMHDLTGQSLSLITLKSELAAKRLARLPQSAELDAVHERGQRHRPGQPADPAGHQGGRERLPAADARRGDHHGPHVAGGRGHPARRRPGPDHAFGHLRPGCRGGPGLVPARGGHQRDPPLRRAELPGPPDGTFG